MVGRHTTATVQTWGRVHPSPGRVGGDDFERVEADDVARAPVNISEEGASLCDVDKWRMVASTTRGLWIASQQRRCCFVERRAHLSKRTEKLLASMPDAYGGSPASRCACY